MKIALAIAAATAVALAGCAKTTTTTEASPAAPGAYAPTAAPMAPGKMKPMMGKVVMNAMSGSGESGTATLTAMGMKTKVDIMLMNEPKGASQPAHIHLGTCAKLNPAPKYPLTNVVNGKSTTTVDEAAKELMATPMAINVHESAANLKKYVSCGNITK